jgi:hypothetical protein
MDHERSPDLEILQKNWLPIRIGENTTGCRILFRRSVACELDRPAARLTVAGATVYRAYLNGECLALGPARSASGYLFADQTDVGDVLHRGNNVLAIELAYFPNTVPLKHQFEFPNHSPGLGVCLSIEAKRALILDSDWRYLQLGCFDAGAPWARGLRSEHVYASGYPSDWTRSDFDDECWDTVEGDRIGACPESVRERPTPPPVVEQHHAGRIIDVGCYEVPERLDTGDRSRALLGWNGSRPRGSTSSGSDDHAPAVEALDRVQFLRVATAHSGGPCAGGTTKPLRGALRARPTVLAGPKRMAAYVVFDLEQILGGTASIDVSIPPGARVDVNLTEWLSGETGAPDSGKNRVVGGLVGAGGFSIIGDGGRIKFESLLQHNFRYIAVVARNLGPGASVVVHSVGMTEVCAIARPDIAASVVCSDPLLNRIVEAAKNTARVNAHDYYVDCTCERIVTSGDCLQSSSAGRLFFGDVGSAISKTMFDSFIDQGLGVGNRSEWQHMPRGRCVAATAKDETMLWMLAPAMLALDILDWSRGESGGMPERYRNLLDGIARDVSVNLGREGLIESTGLMHNWSDWSKMAVGDRGSDYVGVCTSVNAYYYRLFREMSDAFPENAEYADLAERIQSGIRLLASPWIHSNGQRVERFVPDLFVRNDGRLEAFTVPEANVFGGQTQIVSEATQYWLLWSGVLNDDDALRLFDVVRDWRSFQIPTRDNTRVINPSRASSVMGLYPRFEFLRERDDSVLYRDAREAFAPAVLEGGTLWESLEQDSRSAAHATAAYIGAVLFQSLVGLSFDDDRSTVKVAPIIDDTIEWVRGYRRARGGWIGVNWRRGAEDFQLSVGLPSGMRARIHLPDRVLAMLLHAGHDIPATGVVDAEQSVQVTAGRGDGLRVRRLPRDEVR